MEFYPIEAKAKELAATLFFERLRVIGHVNLALVGVTWTLLLGQNRQSITRDAWRKGLFIIATLFFVTAFGFSYYGYDTILASMFFHEAVDLEAPVLNFFVLSEFVMMLGGLAALATLIAALEPNPGKAS